MDEKKEEVKEFKSKPLSKEEIEYTQVAIASGTMATAEIRTVLALARLAKVPPLEYQGTWMDIKIGIQQAWRDMQTGLVDQAGESIIRS